MLRCRCAQVCAVGYFVMQGNSSHSDSCAACEAIGNASAVHCSGPGDPVHNPLPTRT